MTVNDDLRRRARQGSRVKPQGLHWRFLGLEAQKEGNS